MHSLHQKLSLVLLGAASGLAMAQAQLAPPEARISDTVIHQDYQVFQSLQERMHQLNEHGVAVRDYRLAKAQCWLDVSLHEYSRNDRSDFPQAALRESEQLILSLEQGQGAAVPSDTPLVNGAARLRPDIWARAAELHQLAGAPCAWQQLACAEVELVHAGNEFRQQGWRHAKPYIQLAEDWIADAGAAAASCVPALRTPAVPASPLPEPAVVPAPVAPPAERFSSEDIALTAQVLFDFDQSSEQHIRPQSLAQLRQLTERVRREGLTVASLELLGFADRLNHTHQTDYNQKLSQRRVDTVRAWLRAAGLTASSESVDARGDAQQVAACTAQFTQPADLQECLLPNRRVEIRLRARRNPAQ